MHGDNSRNRAGYGKSKYKGVTKEDAGYRVRLLINGKRRSFGYFKNEIDAAKRANEIMIADGNPFYRLNDL